MAMSASSKQPARKQIDRKARMVSEILRKLESTPGIMSGSVHPSQVLNSDELSESVLMMRAAVKFIKDHIETRVRAGKKSFKLPKYFVWRNSRLDLYTSNLGRVFIATKSGTRVLGGGYFEI